MHLLTRRVRFAIGPDAGKPGPNTFAASPAPRGLARHYEIELSLRGEPDQPSGYLADIRLPDRAVRDAVLPLLQRACAERPEADPAPLLPELFDAARASLETLASRASLRSLRLCLSPTLSIEIEDQSMHTALLRQRFDIAAAHRLHVPTLSDDENRRLFGKCNNPSGHGHNYQFEPLVEIPLTGGAPALTLAQLESLAQAAIVDRFDHTHLNLDTPDFSDDAGINPSVENIARVFFEHMRKAVEAHAASLPSDHRPRLRAMTVWETDRTSATYPG
ncbi:MAG: 6-carboxytetrahydropterin synthase [Phycisphaerales bacterium]|jgi:6-pyruvoyltetrahydropterin/6-carboxytetrahydropterin synthase|nr:6-carboxytetrahydropterin synthase [Phycisphaerales bacterium]